MSRVLGVVLAGGESRRFGSDKALAQVDGRPLIAHALAAVAPFAQELAVAGRAYPGAVALSDRPQAGLGPLGGLCGALHHARTQDYDRVLTIACDTPFVPADAFAQLVAQDGACVVAEHPVIGVWPAALAPVLDAFLRDSARRSMRAWMARCEARTIAVPGIANINRPADLDAHLAATRRP